MNKDNYDLLLKMQKNQYYDFIRFALGVKYYLINNGYEVRNKSDEDGEKENLIVERERKARNEHVLAYLYLLGKKKDTFFVKENDYEEKCFRNGTEQKINTRSFFDEIDDYLIWSIMMGVLGVENFSSDTYIDSLDIGKSLFEEKKPLQYRFVLGAGVNTGYGLGNWDGLIDTIRDRIRALKGIPVGVKPDVLVEFEKTMSNTNYIAPQILKDLDSKEYYDALYSNLYSSFNVKDTNRLLKPSIEDTTLYQVARILSKDANSVVLTFNYDDVLEHVLKNNFSTPFKIDYYKSKDKVGGIRIIHSHGFYPYGTAGEKHAHSIVLSCFEYMNGYLRSGSYARKRLYEHIKKTCILIGNSLSDYEEQKVFFLHHKEYLSQFSYLFTTRSDASNRWMDIYKSIYFLKMGVIPVFFDNYPQMINYLKTL